MLEGSTLDRLIAIETQKIGIHVGPSYQKIYELTRQNNVKILILDILANSLKNTWIIAVKLCEW